MARLMVKTKRKRTKDLDAVRAGAHKLADVSGSSVFLQTAVATNGFYAFAGSEPTITVVRQSDGAKQTIDVGPKRVGVPLSISETEIWFQYFVVPSTSGVARIQLGPWP